MAKIALLIGISEYEGLSRLPGTQEDIQSMRRVLENPEVGGFDQVKVLSNPNRIQIEEEIESLFMDNRSSDDLILLYFSGHGVRGDNGTLYFASCGTKKNLQGRIRTGTATSSNVLKQYMSDSRSKRQVLILDCCFSGAFANDMKAKTAEAKTAGDIVDIKAQLGGEGRVVLTSSTALQHSYEKEEGSIYTYYLVQGLETGVADLDSDGKISIDELHEFAREKVQEAAPTMQPEIYAVREGYKIWIARAPQGDPKLIFRKELEERAKEKRGNLSPIVERALEIRRKELGLSAEEAETIKAEVLKPYQIYWANLTEFEQTLQQVLNHDPKVTPESVDDLRYLQYALKLRDEDIAPILNRYPSVQNSFFQVTSVTTKSQLNLLPHLSRELFFSGVFLTIVVAVWYGGNLLLRYINTNQFSKQTSPTSSSQPLEPIQNLISAGDNVNLYGSRSSSRQFRSLINYKSQLMVGISQFKGTDYIKSLSTFGDILNDTGIEPSSPRKDPEILIFQNNSQARLNHQNKGESIYTIAAAVPLSDADGDPFNIGQQILFGIAQAQTKALKDGTNLEVIIANDRNVPEQASKLAEVLIKPTIKSSDNIQREILAVIGHYSSTVTCAALTFYNQAGLAVISPASTRTDLRSNPNCNGGQVFFRTTSSSAVEAQALVNYLINRSKISDPKIAIFYKKGEGFSQDLTNAFMSTLKNYAQVLLFDLSDSEDFDRGKNRLDEFDVLAIFPDGRTSDTTAFNRAIELLKNSGNQLILGANPLYDAPNLVDKDQLPQLRVQLDNPGKGLVVAIDWFSGCDSNTDFIGTANNIWGGDPNRIYAMSYEAVQVIVDRLGQENTNTRAGMLSALSNSQDTVKSDVFKNKTISFDQNGDRNEIKNRILITPGSAEGFDPVEGYCSS